MPNNKNFYAVFETKAGWIGLVGSSTGLSRTTLPQKTKEIAGLLLGEDIRQMECSADYFQELMSEYKSYFSGSRVVFSEKLDLSQSTSFERAVWETTLYIPYGETRSYSWVAGQIGKPLASRAVGRALGKNPLPIIVPCHRVLASSGALCGFGGGLEMKRYLLDLEEKG